MTDNKIILRIFLPGNTHTQVWLKVHFCSVVEIASSVKRRLDNKKIMPSTSFKDWPSLAIAYAEGDEPWSQFSPSDVKVGQDTSMGNVIQNNTLMANSIKVGKRPYKHHERRLSK